MIKPIIILGTGGNSIDILDTINEINELCDTQANPSANIYDCLGFLDDNKENWGKTILGKKVIGPLSAASGYDAYFVNGIGSPTSFHKKHEFIARLGAPDDRWATLIHPTASVSKTASIGPGSVVFQNAVVTSNAQIGKHVVVLPNSIISHDVVVGNYTCIAGGACISGGVQIGDHCYIGANSSIIGNITIGELSLIGMGSVVLRNIPQNTVVAGNPARVIRKTIVQSV